MPGPARAVPVVSAIFALISAFNDGTSIVEKLRIQRSNIGAPVPDERLHRVLALGAEKIEDLRKEGVEEYGEAFTSDAATASRLKDITIALQDSIIKHFAAAYYDDSQNDFTPAINSVIQARREATVVLNDLYMTLQRGRDQIDQAVQAEALRLQSQHDMPKTIKLQEQNIMPEPLNLQRQSDVPEPLRPRRQNATLDTAVTRKQEITPETTGASVTSSVAKASDLSSSSLTQRPRSLSLLFSRRRRPVTEPVQRPQSQPVFTEPSSNITEMLPRLEEEPPSTLLRAPSQSSVTPTVRSSNLSIVSVPQGPHAFSKIKEASKYAGFCEGAWHAQHFRLKKAMEPSLKRYERAYHCKKCKFQLLADTSGKGNPHFDDRMQISGTVYFRFLFLWKSHVPTKDETRNYQCLLCVLSGQTTRIFRGEDRLFEHIIQHKGGYCGDTLISGALEVHEDRVSVASIGTYDFYIPSDTESREPTPLLTDSAASLEPPRPFSPQLWHDEPYEKEWRGTMSHAVELDAAEPGSAKIYELG